MKIPALIYQRRIAKEIMPYFNDEITIVIHGARQVGKTYLFYYLINALQEKKEKTFYFDLEDSLLLSTFNQGYTALLQLLQASGYQEDKAVYVFIDEIQYLDNPSSFIKLLTVHHKNIHLLVSGSSTFAIKSKFKDSLVGRTINFELFPLSFVEFIKFKGHDFSLNKINDPYHIALLKTLYTEYVMYGGYPKIVLTSSVEKKKKFLSQIIDSYIRKDIKDLGKIEDIKKFNRLLFVLASQTGQLLNVARLSKETSLSIPTINKYLFLLEQTFILKLLPPFSQNPHVEIVKNPKIYFYDSGLASLLWLHDFPKILIGNLFETSIFSEFVKKYGHDSLFFWRTKNKQEIDFILRLKKSILPIEVKINFGAFNKKTILAFCDRYRLAIFKVTALEGKKSYDYEIYPWEI